MRFGLAMFMITSAAMLDVSGARTMAALAVRRCAAGGRAARVKGRVEFADVPVGKELELATVSPETSCVMFQHMGEG